jgi:hypothetical protein
MKGPNIVLSAIIFLKSKLIKRLFNYSIAIPQKCLRISSPKLYPAQNMSFVYFTMHFTLLKKLIYEAQLGGHVLQDASGAFPQIPLAPWKAPLARHRLDRLGDAIEVNIQGD